MASQISLGYHNLMENRLHNRATEQEQIRSNNLLDTRTREIADADRASREEIAQQDRLLRDDIATKDRKFKALDAQLSREHDMRRLNQSMKLSAYNDNNLALTRALLSGDAYSMAAALDAYPLVMSRAGMDVPDKDARISLGRTINLAQLLSKLNVTNQAMNWYNNLVPSVDMTRMMTNNQIFG